LLDLIAYISVRALNLIFYFVPIEAILWLGRRIGGAIFFFNKKRRVIAYANLKAAFAGQKTPLELRRLTKAVYVNMAQTFAEILNLTKVNTAYTDKYVEVMDHYRIDNAAKSGKGTILLTAHFGDWELSSLTSAMHGYPIMVLVREQKMKRLNELLNRLRELKGCKVIRKGMETKNILKGLKNNDIVGILSDQDAGRSGTFVNFFGRPTSTHSGAMIMAERTGCIILPNFIVRTHGPYHKLYLEEYIDVPKGSGEEGIRKGLQQYADVLEKYVRKYPDQWLWLHKRWKSTPTRTILVLNDGKAGHLNQSLAVARQIQIARTTQGYALDDTKISIVDVKYRSKLARSILTAKAAVANWRWHGRMGCMKAALDENSYEKLMATYSEFVVSCASSLAPVNILMAIENNATNIIIMKPGFPLGFGKFKLAIVPRHDRPPRRHNVVSTDMAPNLIDREMLESQGEKIRAVSGLPGGRMMGLLIGGDNPEFALSADSINKVIDDTIRFSKTTGALILATTSRRTSKDVEDILKKRLKNEPLCKLLIIANEKNLDDAVGGILALCEVVVVSGESVSMVSEAIASGKKVVAFELEKKAEGATKHERVLKGLEADGYVRVAKPDSLFEALNAAWSGNVPGKENPDKQKIYDAVRRLI
jgi:Kdo2-lipid IVA lauroyltransferase/acyltransferase